MKQWWRRQSIVCTGTSKPSSITIRLEQANLIWVLKNVSFFSFYIHWQKCQSFRLVYILMNFSSSFFHFKLMSSGFRMLLFAHWAIQLSHEKLRNPNRWHPLIRKWIWVTGKVFGAMCDEKLNRHCLKWCATVTNYTVNHMNGNYETYTQFANLISFHRFWFVVLNFGIILNSDSC